MTLSHSDIYTYMWYPFTVNTCMLQYKLVLMIADSEVENDKSHFITVILHYSVVKLTFVFAIISLAKFTVKLGTLISWSAMYFIYFIFLCSVVAPNVMLVSPNGMLMMSTSVLVMKRCWRISWSHCQPRKDGTDPQWRRRMVVTMMRLVHRATAD